jgi:hypothetical protein
VLHLSLLKRDSTLHLYFPYGYVSKWREIV